MSTATAPLPVNFDNIPPSLRTLKQWVGWRLIDRDGNPVKTPVQPNKRFAKSNDPSTWSHLAAVRNSYARGDVAGIGFMLADAGDVIMIDLDGCRDSTTGEFRPWSDAIKSHFHDPSAVPHPEKLIQQFATYAEVSPSGTGYRLFARGTLPPGGRKIGGKGSGCPDGLEMYSSRRYGTFTGHKLPDSADDLTEPAEALQSVHKAVFGPPSGNMNHTPSGTVEHTHGAVGDDRTILSKAVNAANGDKVARLLAGDASDYPSASEADLSLADALAFWTGPDSAAIERLMRQSRLKRDKWDRNKDYLPRTIARVLSTRSDYFRWNGEATTRPRAFPRTDTGLAERFAADHAGKVRYCYPWGKWLVWDGRRWKIDDGGSVERLAKETVRQMYAEASKIEDDAQRKAAAQHARDSESVARRSAMTRLAQCEVPVLPDALDQDPWLLNCENGTLDLRTGVLREHRPADCITKLAPVEYHPEADAPTWLDFRATIFAGNSNVDRFVQRLAGYCLTGIVRDQVLPIFWGSGSNGKSTFLTALHDMLGDDYSMAATPDMLMLKRGDAHPTERADLFGKRLVTAVETGEHRRLSEPTIKALTGGDRIRARRMREDFWEFAPTHKLVLATNHRPIVHGTDHAIWRRLRLVPFTVCIPDAEQDKSLPEKLKNELPGILRWALGGCLGWQREDLGEPEEVRAATAEYRSNQDALGQFLAECCIKDPTCRAKASELLDAYHTWAGDNRMTQRRFGESMTERGFTRKVSGGVWYEGVGLTNQYEGNL